MQYESYHQFIVSEKLDDWTEFENKMKQSLYNRIILETSKKYGEMLFDTNARYTVNELYRSGNPVYMISSILSILIKYFKNGKELKQIIEKDCPEFHYTIY